MNVDIDIDEVDPQQARELTIKFIEQAITELYNPALKPHDIEHAIFDLQTAISFINY